MTPDAELLHRYAEKNDEAAFAELVHRHLSLVYSAALRRMGGDAHGAADVAQQVFTTLARRGAALSRHTVLTAWLYTATRNASIDLLRAEHRRRVREQEARMNELDQRPHSEPEWESLRPIIDATMDNLSDVDRAAVLLRFFEKRSFGEIGAALRLTEDAARMRVDRALRKLHALLARRGITSTSTALGAVLASQATAAVMPVGLAGNVAGTAIAGAAAASVVGPAVAVFGFMSTSKMMVAVAVMLAIGGVGSALFEHAKAQRAEMGLAAAQHERDAVHSRLDLSEAKWREAERRAQVSEARSAALEKSTTAATVAPSRAGEIASATAKPATADPNPGMDPMLANPDYVRLFVQKYQAELRLKFGGLYKVLNLSPEQIAKFEANRTEFQRTGMEVWSSAMAQGISIGDPSVTKLTGDSMKGLEADLRALLGDAGYRQFLEYSRAESARDLATSLAGYLYPEGTPLSSQQGEQLVHLIAGNTRRVQDAPPSKVVRYVVDWDAVVGRASSVLAPNQLSTFQALVDGKKVDQQMSQLRSAARGGNMPKPGG